MSWPLKKIQSFKRYESIEKLRFILHRFFLSRWKMCISASEFNVYLILDMSRMNMKTHTREIRRARKICEIGENFLPVSGNHLSEICLVSWRIDSLLYVVDSVKSCLCAARHTMLDCKMGRKSRKACSPPLTHFRAAGRHRCCCENCTNFWQLANSSSSKRENWKFSIF